MNRRAECRRRRRYAAKGRVDPRLHDRLEDQRVLPKGHPNRDDGALMSSRDAGKAAARLCAPQQGCTAHTVQLNGLIDRENDMRLLGPRPGPKVDGHSRDDAAGDSDRCRPSRSRTDAPTSPEC